MVVAVSRGVTVSDSFHRFASRVSAVLGTPWSFLAAIGTIVVWLATRNDLIELELLSEQELDRIQDDLHRARAVREARAKRGPLPLGPSNPR